MIIEYVQGDLLKQTDIRLIVQGCNARGVMGKGLAKAIREMHPEVFIAYRQRYENQNFSLQLGEVIWVQCKHPADRWIANLISQDGYRRDPNERMVHADYDAIERGVASINAHVKEHFTNGVGETRVGFPLIGAGLAGGLWSEVKARIEKQAVDFIPVVFLLDGKLPA